MTWGALTLRAREGLERQGRRKPVLGAHWRGKAITLATAWIHTITSLI